MHRQHSFAAAPESPTRSACEARDWFPLLQAFERGSLSPRDTLGLFADLLATGLVWRLADRYVLATRSLIRVGWLSESGQPNPVLLASLCSEVGCTIAEHHVHAPACSKAPALGCQERGAL